MYNRHNLPKGKPMTLKILSNWSWWYGLLVLMSSWRQWKIGSEVRSSAKMHPMAHISNDTRKQKEKLVKGCAQRRYYAWATSNWIWKDWNSQRAKDNIHKYLRQFRYSYCWRVPHVGVYKSLFVTSNKCWNMGVTHELAPVLIRQFLHSYWSRATAKTVVPHQATRATRQHSLITKTCLALML